MWLKLTIVLCIHDFGKKCCGQRMIFLLRGIIVDIKLVRVECNSIIEVQAKEEKRVYI